MAEGIEMPDEWLNEKTRVINELVDEECLKTSGHRLLIRDQGRPLLNAIIGRLLAA
jgi:hypothetical protein